MPSDLPPTTTDAERVLCEDNGLRQLFAAVEAAPTSAFAAIGPPDTRERLCLCILRARLVRRYARAPEAFSVYDERGRVRPPHRSLHAHAALARDALRPFGCHSDVKDRRVLDVGCGDGTLTIGLSMLGPAFVVGLDAEPARLARARRASDGLGLRGRIGFVLVGPRGALPCGSESVDVVVMHDVMEHLSDPAGTLADCHRVLRRGGRVLCSFKPWFSPRGSHVTDWIYIPWNHILFPEHVLVRVLRRIAEHCPHVALHYPTLLKARLPRDLKELADGGLNRITLRRFRRVVAGSGFRVAEERLEGRQPGSSSLTRNLLDRLARLPLLNECLGALAVTVLEKA